MDQVNNTQPVTKPQKMIYTDTNKPPSSSSDAQKQLLEDRELNGDSHQPY